MKSKKLLALGSALLLVAGFVSLGALPANAGNENNQNEIVYWQNLYGAATTTCAKDQFGSITTDSSGHSGVTLTGAHTWLSLIVNSGSVDYGQGPGNKVYPNPVAGTHYLPPLNNGGQQGAVSHWIVCWTTPTTPQDASASATPTDATCEASGGVNFSITNATWENDTDLTDGSRLAIANAGHLFPGGASTLAVTYTIAPQLTGEQCDGYPQDASASATPTDATCEASGGVNFSITNATWENDTDLTDGSRLAIANAGHLFPGGASTLAVTYTIAPQLTGERCQVDYVTVGDPYAVDLICDDGFTDGYIWVDFGGNLANELDYRIQGGPTNVDFLATQEVNVLDPGDYTVTAIAKPGHTLDPNAQSVWLLTIGVSGDCQLISHPPVTPTASMSNLTCSSNGSYTLVDSEGIKWLVNGVATPAGTYKVTSASTVNVEAQLTSTIDYTWEDGAQTTWTFEFTNPKDCLPTLAFTGASGGDLGLLLAGGLLFLGGAVIAVDRRLRLGSN